MPRPVKIFFASYADAGQLNVHLAVMDSLLRHHGGEVDLHLCSFALARKRCPERVKFYEMPGLSHIAAVQASDTPEAVEAALMHTPSFMGVFRAAVHAPIALSPYPASEYISITKHIEDALQNVQPDLVIVDNLFPQGRDAARRLGFPQITLSPNAWQDNAIQEQALGVFSWPLTGTGWPYPLPLHLIPLNAILIFTLLLSFALSTQHRAKLAARKAAGYTGSMLGTPDDIRLCMGMPEFELPGIRPAKVISIGPILLPSPPLASVDPELDAWINHSGSEEMFTITFALGTHADLTLPRAEALLGMFARLMEKRKDVRIYAKIMRKGKYDLPLLRELQDNYGSQRLRVVEWMKTDPVVLLNTGKVGLVIHHGGSNSYHEALRSLGIPQIVVASWFDCYDFAARVESLGIGKWGNRLAGPGFTAKELGAAINGVLASYPSYETRAKVCANAAKGVTASVKSHDGSELSVPSSSKGLPVGRDVAAEWIFGKARSEIST